MDFPPATNAALLATSSSLPKLSHLRDSHGGGNYFHSKAANARFYRRNQFRSESQILNLILGQRLNRSPVHEAKFHGTGASLPVQWNA